MSTETVYAMLTTGGYVESFHAVYATARAGGGSLVLGAQTYGAVGQNVGYYAYNGYIDFDLTLLATGGTVTVPVLSLWGSGAGSGWQINCYVRDFGAAMTTADWFPGDSPGTLRAHIAIASLTGGAYRAMTDDAMAAAIEAALGGHLRLLFLSDRQIAATVPSADESALFEITSGGGNEPRLVFELAAAAAGGNTDQLGRMGIFGI